ncbi:Superfamily II DNA and RNA helicase [Reichenbachiella agariperforans]|uniref:Superfamily II DNA and RNA helicase n=1 Tax=Reichenbachiella agariperforans TaxID=156994 RepID=A0A1M6K854_REIAG|nr:DEAD/DEAH box helicase [Reichenbachiella agariperforans]SHJ55166.1 Superfamily II DNA and RNA helicase [Reichenbachiella agariperforans]
MSATNKDQKAILSKLGIAQLNPMQEQAHEAISTGSEVILLSPTGTGKTLAFLLPIIAQLDPNSDQIQVLILVPSRELAIQIEQVIREIGSGFKTNAIYGGRSGSKDRIELKHAPAILVGTPGRVADHIRRENIDTDSIQTLVLDEFDKSLEVGFESEMTEIVSALPYLTKKVLTSATQKGEIPAFVGLQNPQTISFLGESKSLLTLKVLSSPSRNKLDSLLQLLGHVGDKNGILFCSLKDTIQTVSNFLHQQDIGHECFYGGLEQIDRERALIKFRNGTSRLLVATDLAARGIDVPELDFIIHYELPVKQEEFTHRNGRTARMHSDGTAYILKWENESLPDFVQDAEDFSITSRSNPVSSMWETLYISGGRKDKISKGDIAGLFFKQGELKKDELGTIELKQDCAFVAVPRNKVRQLTKQLNNTKLKTKKVRITLLE